MSNIPTTPERNQAQNKRRYTTSPSPKVYRNGIPGILSNRTMNSDNPNSSSIDRRSLDGQANITSTGIKSIISRMPSSLNGANSNGTSFSGSGSKSNHLTSFYNEQMKELNDLQDTLAKKKAKLDGLRDIVSNGKEEFNETKLKWDKLRDSKVAKEQQLKVKQNEMAKLKETIEARRKFLEEGHKLHLQQMEVENQTKINKLINEYKEKIEEVKKRSRLKNLKMKETIYRKRSIVSNPR